MFTLALPLNYMKGASKHRTPEHGVNFNSTCHETVLKLPLILNTTVLMTPIVTFIAILITPRPPPAVHERARTPPPRHALRDTRLFLLVKEIALLCWLFYLKPWLPLCAPDHALTESRLRAAGLIGAWDARGGAARLGGRRGGASNGFACAWLSALASLSLSLSASPGLGCNALIGQLLIPPTVIKSPAQNYYVIC